ncbi:MAG: transposase [Eubacteriales bacterium]|nr:transposase [Eubacteriales bacterium]
MRVHRSDDFKKEVVMAYMKGDKSIKDIAIEYNVARSTVSDWARKYSEECQYKNTTLKTDESAVSVEIRRLNLQLKEKEIEFLKKAAAFFAKEID